ncbi:PET117 [[Candida] subhashii]|uniref:PET117 n=1 Tax=[Candida] subhashii TaxID=561895 RepID=A0A8J5UGB7_9ASCO|nr:PET117 [[Candida] subhashii]KAG7662373.1 PET117 [[Candida] subhashii]
MSTASKVTFAASCVFATAAFAFINYSQQTERDALRQGPIKDAARMQAKLTKKQLANDAEHREQAELREKYLKMQPLSSEIIRGEETPIPPKEA